jgi:hypothetical protein
MPRRTADSPPASSSRLFPSNDDVSERLDTLQRRHAERLTRRRIGATAEARPIEAVEITDPSSDPQQKQHVLIVAGQHGNEESARLVALRLIDYLLTADAKPVLKRQRIVIVPNLSPDAAARDCYTTPAGIKPNLDHAASGPVSPEARAFETIANELQPELFVDIHARGHAGCSHDMVLFPPTRPYTEDESVLHALAREMAEHGERSGIPHLVHPLTWPGWGGHDLEQPSSTLWMYRQFKSLVFLTENSEHNDHLYPERMRARSGVGRLKPLLAAGNRRHPSLYHAGYPCAMAVGMFNAGIVATGANAAARRDSRVNIWRQSASFEVAAQLPERAGTKVMQIKYAGPALACGVGVQVRVAGKVLPRSVSVNGRGLEARESDGFVTWQDRYTTFAVASIPELSKGEFEVAFRFQ